MKIGYIYKATNKINGKSYIGKTINFKSRKAGHLQCAKKNVSGLFYNAIRKYGQQNFEWTILFKDYCHPNKLNELEKFFIAYYETFGKNGYNLTFGGDGCWFKYHPNRTEIYTRLNKQAAFKRKNTIDPTTGLKLSVIHQLKSYKTKLKNNTLNPNSFTGKHHTEEFKNRMSIIMQEKTKGKNNSQYGTIWITNGIENKKIKKEEFIPEGWYKGRKLVGQ